MEQVTNYLVANWPVVLIAVCGWLYGVLSDYIGMNPNIQHNAVIQLVMAGLKNIPGVGGKKDVN